MKTQRVARPSDTRNALNLNDVLSDKVLGLISDCRCRTLKARSEQQAMKRHKEATCHPNPAIMTFMPIWVVGWSLAVLAMPPPTPCRTRDRKSQATKVRV